MFQILTICTETLNSTEKAFNFLEDAQNNPQMFFFIKSERPLP